ncbi:helix-turn-helix transcriptional regulator [Pseudobacillus sp. FSL P4-0506]|uniref:helix-turn-helix domain-containing protein n=1 Tax=Pseudobacillus sp. FSL P4-0506 TaxID=2921576 RepID=UPI0030F9C73A
MAIHNNMRTLMAKNRIKTLQEVADKTGYPYHTVRGFENGTHKRVNGGLIEALCDLFNCSIQDLMFIEKKKKAGV